MALPRLLLAWLLVTLWFVAWHETRHRLADLPSRSLPAAEALLLTLFSALWFASLGHGGWWLLFLLVALLIEVPVRIRQHRTPLLPWREVALGVVRVVLAGGLRAWRLG
jgi:hypothetical protein